MVFEPTQRGLRKHYGAVLGMAALVAGAVGYFAVVRPAFRFASQPAKPVAPTQNE